MAAFEISVNGKPRFVEEDVKAITIVADRVPDLTLGGEIEKVYLHVGIGEAGEYQYLGGDLRPGDEISIRVLTDDEIPTGTTSFPTSCSFCGSDHFHISSLTGGPQVAICDGCLQVFHAVIIQGARLPLGASIRDQGPDQCDFCHKAPPEVPGLLVRNSAAICPECLRACLDLITEQ